MRTTRVLTLTAAVAIAALLATCAFVSAGEAQGSHREAARAGADDPSPPATPVKLIFIHHSTGGNWLADPNDDQPYGGLARALMNNNYYVSATNYGWGPDSIGDRTDIPNWPEWFTGPNRNTILAALFVVITAPPLMASEPAPARAANARAFNNWLVNDWLAGYPYRNVAVFDYYNVLTSNGGDADTNDLGQEAGNHHRWWNGAVQHIQTVNNNYAAYPSGDSHPSTAGQQKATGEFVQLLNVLFLNPAGVETDMLGVGPQRRSRLGDVAYDRSNGLLYVLELYADEAKPVVHVWRVQ